MLKNLYSTVFVLLLFTTAVAQNTAGTLKGTVKDKTTGEALPFATVVVLNGQTQVAAGSTDFDGQFVIKPIPIGTYDVRCVFVGYNTILESGVPISGGKITFKDFKMFSGVDLDEVVITRYKKPLIEKDGGSSGGSVSRDDIAKMSARSATSVATTVGGVSSAGTREGEVSIRGARQEDTFYYIDGIKVRGNANLPKSAIEEVTVITGGLPANIGDASGGIISITTRGAQSQFFGGVDLLSSGFKSGDRNVGLDPFGQTIMEGFFAGPLIFRKDSTGKKTDPLMGFFLSGNYKRFEDTRPSAVGYWYIKDDALAEIKANPSIINETEVGDDIVYSSIQTASFLTADDFEKKKASKNAGETAFSGSGKLDFNFSPEVTLSVGASGDYQDLDEFLFRNYATTSALRFVGTGRAVSRSNSLMNYENNGTQKELSWRTFATFTQRFKSDNSDENKAVVKNAFYSISADYSNFSRTREDRTHQDNFFNYGHIGKFDVHRQKFFEDIGVPNAVFQNFYQDTLVTFTPSELNPDIASITSQYFNVVDDPENYRQLTDLTAANILLNGDAPNDVYEGLWTIPGKASNLYQLRDNNQIRILASGSADIGDHAITMGVEYEQRVDRGYDLAPVGLWGRARQLTNFVDNVQVIDSVISPTTIEGNFQVSQVYAAAPGQSLFNLKFREALGYGVGDPINVDGEDPESLSIDMFSADDLLQNGTNLVSYYGYDHTGNKLSSDPSFEDYFNDVDEYGYNTKLLGAFRPIYNSFFLMDKFSFDDIIFNVGVRVDRYDANQKVLKDDYIVGDFYTVGNSPLGSIDVPDGIEDDYIIYVEDITASPGDINIVGYRDGDDWFDANGTPINTPTTIATATNFGPYLTQQTLDKQTTQELDVDGFKDYEPVVNVMPRLAFSFPISDEAVFFAHFDVLTQRPSPTRSRLDLISYDFIETNTNQNPINNPNLRPSKTIDYALGFQQVLSKSSSLKIEAFYRDMRDMVNLRPLVEAWPNNGFITYRNNDFGTVKGLTFSYDLRRTGNIRMLANYTLQFATSTGSNDLSGLTLARAGLPNLRSVLPVAFDRRHAINVTLDYRYGSGKDYNGPVWFGKNIFQNTGANLIADIGSGTPYTASLEAGSILSGARGIVGSPNGTLLPGSTQLNLQIDRDITLKFGKDDESKKAKRSNMNVYLLINNLLNAKIVRNVYTFSGDPDGDGYLASTFGQNEITQIESGNLSAESFVDFYNMRLLNQYNYGLARTIQLGIRLDF